MHMPACHCIAHRHALACEDASNDNEVAQFVENGMHSVVNYHSNSNARKANLAAIQKTLQIAVLVMLKLVATRWLSRGGCATRIHTAIVSLYAEFGQDAKRKVTTAVALVALVGSYRFVLALTIFRGILTTLNLVSKCFQKEHVRYGEMRGAIDAALDGFETCYLHTGDGFAGSPCYRELEAAQQGESTLKYMGLNLIVDLEVETWVQDFRRGRLREEDLRRPERANPSGPRDGGVGVRLRLRADAGGAGEVGFGQG